MTGSAPLDEARRDTASDAATAEPGDERSIAFVVYPGLALLDLAGPLQTLHGLGAPYRTVTVGRSVAPMPSDVGLSVTPEATFAEVERPFAIVVPGGGQGTIE